MIWVKFQWWIQSGAKVGANYDWPCMFFTPPGGPFTAHLPTSNLLLWVAHLTADAHPPARRNLRPISADLLKTHTHYHNPCVWSLRLDPFWWGHTRHFHMHCGSFGACLPAKNYLGRVAYSSGVSHTRVGNTLMPIWGISNSLKRNRGECVKGSWLTAGAPFDQATHSLLEFQ